MDFVCHVCGGQVVRGMCQECHTVFIVQCPLCDNRISFEEVAVGNVRMWRCSTCENETDLQMVVLHQPS